MLDNQQQQEYMKNGLLYLSKLVHVVLLGQAY